MREGCGTAGTGAHRRLWLLAFCVYSPAAFNGITLALTAHCVSAQVPGFWYSLDPRSLPASEQMQELCQKWLSHGLASLLPQHSQTHTLPPPQLLGVH